MESVPLLRRLLFGLRLADPHDDRAGNLLFDHQQRDHRSDYGFAVLPTLSTNSFERVGAVVVLDVRVLDGFTNIVDLMLGSNLVDAFQMIWMET